MYLNFEFTVYMHDMTAAEYHEKFRWQYFSNVRYYKGSAPT
jgi:hypothetical protein